MTRKEACKLEKQVDAKFSEALGEACKCSLTLTSRFKITFDRNILCLERDGKSVEHIHFDGEYSDLNFYANAALACFRENRDSIVKLIWSYEHIGELTD